MKSLVHSSSASACYPDDGPLQAVGECSIMSFLITVFLVFTKWRKVQKVFKQFLFLFFISLSLKNGSSLQYQIKVSGSLQNIMQVDGYHTESHSNGNMSNKK